MTCINLTGKRFGKLVVIKRSKTVKFRTCTKIMWSCKCDCGKTVDKYGDMIRNGHTTSCGCFKGAPGVGRTHGLSVGKVLTPELKLYYSAKTRARAKKLEFKIRPEDISIPLECPLLGIKIKSSVESLSDGSPTLDRIDNDIGYVAGNIWVISYKANRCKSNLTIDELQHMVDNLKRKITSNEQN